MNSYKSTLAALIQEAVDNCIVSGHGVAEAGEFHAVADWSYNENDIDVNIYQRHGLIGSFTEQGVADKIY